MFRWISRLLVGWALLGLGGCGEQLTIPEEDNQPPVVTPGEEIVDPDGRYRIVWETEEMSDSRVVFWLHNGGTTHHAETLNEFGASHEVRLLDLTANERYDYFSLGLDADGDTLHFGLQDSLVTGPIGEADLLKAHFIDVKQGDACLIESPRGAKIVIDGGYGSSSDADPPSWDGDGVPYALNYLESMAVEEIALMIKSHNHADHYGGLSDINNSSINILEMQAPFTGFGYSADWQRGDIVQVDPVCELKILNIGYPPGASTENENNSSIVLKVVFGEFSLLMTGDAEIPVESYLLQNYFADLSSTALKVNHHGSSDGTTDEWMAAVQPRAAAISCGAGNPYGHPHGSTLQILQSHSVDVYRTDLLGDIVVVSDGAAGWEWIY
jgi:competence protein ComEC